MIQTLQLTRQQQNAISTICDWVGNKLPLIALAGPAGSGKTTTIKALVKELKKFGNVQVCATTNKAARVLCLKGIDAITMHQACMRPLFRPPLDKLANFLAYAESVDDNSKISKPSSLLDQYSEDQLNTALDTTRRVGVCSALRQLGIQDIFSYLEGWLPAPEQDGILIIDEASMLGDLDLATVQNVFKVVILVGDEFQLPPVKGKPVFWEVEARVALTEIHRQAAGSQPLELATQIRQGETVKLDPVEKVNIKLSQEGIPVIVWKNETRIKLTDVIRSQIGYRGMSPQVGEVLICRGGDRTAKDRGLINNSLWTVLDANDFVCDLVNDAGEILRNEHVFIEELNKGDGVPFRFAYAITCHSSQGSQWPEVMIHKGDALAFNRFRKEESRKWLYTAITRAEKQVRWVQ